MAARPYRIAPGQQLRLIAETSPNVGIKPASTLGFFIEEAMWRLAMTSLRSEVE